MFLLELPNVTTESNSAHSLPKVALSQITVDTCVFVSEDLSAVLKI